MALQPEIAERPEVRALVEEAQRLVASTAQLKILTPADYVDAGELLKRVKGRQRDLKAMRESITKPMNTALKAVRDLFTRPEMTLETAEHALKYALSSYSTEQERQRREEQRKLDEEAQREREQLERDAASATARGDSDEAADLIERSARVVSPIIQQDAPRVAGISQRELWRAEVTDLRTLVRAVAEGQVPLAAIEANSTFLNGQARQLRQELRYPGVRAVPERTIAAGSA